jgi:hypothetical protein
MFKETDDGDKAHYYTRVVNGYTEVTLRGLQGNKQAGRYGIIKIDVPSVYNEKTGKYIVLSVLHAVA